MLQLSKNRDLHINHKSCILATEKHSECHRLPFPTLKYSSRACPANTSLLLVPESIIKDRPRDSCHEMFVDFRSGHESVNDCANQSKVTDLQDDPGIL